MALVRENGWEARWDKASTSEEGLRYWEFWGQMRAAA